MSAEGVVIRDIEDRGSEPEPFGLRFEELTPAIFGSTDMRNPDTTTYNRGTEDNDT